MSNYVLCYTRKPVDSVLYDPRLAYSMHLALSSDGVHYRGLNHNSGVLFSLATENENGSLNAMSLKNPFLFSMKDGTFGVLAIRIEADGDRDESSKGSVLFWTSEDLLVYQEVGLIQLSDCYIERVTCCYHESGDCYQISWLDETGRTFCGELDMLQSGKGSVTAKEVSTLMALPELGEVQQGY